MPNRSWPAHSSFCTFEWSGSCSIPMQRHAYAFRLTEANWQLCSWARNLPYDSKVIGSIEQSHRQFCRGSSSSPMPRGKVEAEWNDPPKCTFQATVVKIGWAISVLIWQPHYEVNCYYNIRKDLLIWTGEANPPQKMLGCSLRRR